VPAYRSTARAVGVLFIVASATAILGGSLLLPIGEENYLNEAAASQGQVVSGALLEMVLALSVVAIAALLFPVLKRTSEGLAIGYVGARVLEGVLLLAATMSALVVLALALEESASGAAATVDLMRRARDATYLVGSMVMFGAGAVVLYALLYRGNLVPAWLSLWGLAGGVLILVRGGLELYGIELSALWQGLFAAPIGLNEMVLALWLIFRGFRIPAAGVLGEVAASRP
jgi:hypothetical protein